MVGTHCLRLGVQIADTDSDGLKRFSSVLAFCFGRNKRFCLLLYSCFVTVCMDSFTGFQSQSKFGEQESDSDGYL